MKVKNCKKYNNFWHRNVLFLFKFRREVSVINYFFEIVVPNGKVLPSGVVLQKLFDIIDRNIFETTFLEAVKCYPLIRKNLKTILILKDTWQVIRLLLNLST